MSRGRLDVALSFAMRVLTTTLCAGLLATSAMAAEPAWVTVRSADDVAVQTRQVPESAFPEFRIQAHSRHAPAELAEALWNPRRSQIEAKMFELQRVLSQSAVERVEYLRIHPMLISRRDYTLRFTRYQDSEGRFHIDFETDSGAGPPPSPDYVRMRLIRGSWVLEPDGDGTRVTHQCLSDPSGDVPVWLARGEQQSIAEALVREVLSLPTVVSLDTSRQSPAAQP